MAFHEVDERQAEADRMFDHFTRQGCDPDVTAAMLPALVAADPEIVEWASDWLLDHGQMGHGPEVQTHARIVVGEAHEFLNDLMEAGGFVGDPMFEPGNRYSAMADPKATEATWNEMNPNIGMYADKRNAQVIEQSDAQALADSIAGAKRFTEIASVEDQIRGTEHDAGYTWPEA